MRPISASVSICRSKTRSVNWQAHLIPCWRVLNLHLRSNVNSPQMENKPYRMKLGREEGKIVIVKDSEAQP